MAEIVHEKYALSKALSVLKAGGLVALPTETVYGLAGDATSETAIGHIFKVKGRPQYNPLIAHVSSLEMAQSVVSFDPIAKNLAEAFWPGPLSLVLPQQRNSKIHPLACAGLGTLAVRMPPGFCKELIEDFGRPLVAPSANTSGRTSPTTSSAVAKDLGEFIDLIVDGGKTILGLESTILQVKDGRVQILRPGMLTTEDIEGVIGIKIERKHETKIQAPGMMKSHYAPKTKIRLNAIEIFEGEALLAFGAERAKNASKAKAIRNLSPEANLREAAANLFDYLHILDAVEASMIAVEPIPANGYGDAINDRLMRAATLSEK